MQSRRSDCLSGLSAHVHDRATPPETTAHNPALNIIPAHRHPAEAALGLAGEWSVPFHAGWLLTPRRDGKDSAVQEYRLSPRQVVELKAAETELSGNPPPPKKMGGPSTTGAFLCGAGRNSFVITASGEMNACIDLARPAARPLECGFPKAWEQVGRFVDSVPASAICGSCELEPACPRCPALSLIETGNLTAPVPYLGCATQKWSPAEPRP